jgi:DNA-binding beta-propeller fold protein YncE/mono/diheme cytochrome c family protein
MVRRSLRFPLLALAFFGCNYGAHALHSSDATRVTGAARAAKALANAGPTAPPLPLLLRIEPLDPDGAVSAGTVALARFGQRTFAFIADADDGAVVTFDVDLEQSLASTPLGARPSAVLVTGDGRIVALGADDARVHVFGLADPDRPLVRLRTIEVPTEPISAAAVPKTGSLLVTSRWGHALTLVDPSGTQAARTVDLPRDPGAAVASSDGRRAFVVHAVGSRASVVDLATMTAQTSSLDRTIHRTIFREMMMMPQASRMELTPIDLDSAPAPPMVSPPNAPPAQAVPIEPDVQALPPIEPPPKARPITKHALVPSRPEVEAVRLHADQGFALARVGDERIVAPDVDVDTGPAQPTGGYGGGFESPATPGIASFDEKGGGTPSGERVLGSSCLLPRGVATDPQTHRLFVACLGTAQIVVMQRGPSGWALYDTVSVPKGPTGIAIDPGGRRAVVWSGFDRAVSVLELGRVSKLRSKKSLSRMATAPSAEALRGRVLFNSSFDERVSSDGRGCASCHPDGRDDGMTWSSPGGRRETPMLLERIEGTAPYGWDGAAKDFRHHLTHTTARLGGDGLGKGDVADIEAYLGTLHPPAGPPERPETLALVARGKAVFDSAEAGCSGCHEGAASTDGDVHDVGSAAKGDARKSFDTPSLHLVAHSAPYFHDGRYATLSDLLVGVDGTMGQTAQLSPGDRAALQAYLEQL